MRKLGKTAIEITPIILGTWQAGKQYWVGIDDAESIRTIRGALDAGINAFDTASEYGDGHSERIVGTALGDVRDRVVLMTKIYSDSLRRDLVVASCERSLANLGTDYIDLLQIHWPSGCWGSQKVPIEETMEALNRLKEQGKIRAIGISNFHRAQTEEAAHYGRIDSTQPPYSLLWRNFDVEVRPYCEQHDITILAYSPLAQGLLTGRFQRGAQFADTDPRRDNKLFDLEVADEVEAVLAGLRALAERKGCTMAQLALAWTIAQPLTCAIAGARSPAQAIENASAMQVELSADELAEMERLARPVSDRFIHDPLLWHWQP